MPISRYLAVCLALALFGCGGNNAPAPQPPADPTPPTQTARAPADTEKAPPKGDAPSPPPAPAPAGWTQDLKEMRFPADPARGQLVGRPFTPQAVELSRLRGRFLSLRQGEDVIPDLEVRILLSAAKDETFSGKVYDIAADGPSTSPADALPPVTLLWKPKDRQTTETAVFPGKYALRLEFGQESDGKLPGKIYLCLPDEAKSYVAGTFTADVEPDYAKPPRPDEMPCVVGRVALKGRDELSVVTGLVGLTADGLAVTNLTGTVIAPDVETSVSSVAGPSQRSALANDAVAGCVCRHARLAPGRYLVFVGSGDRYIDWRWVEVKDRTPPALDFSLDPKTAGALEVALPKDVTDGVRLIPLDEAGKVPDIKDAMSALSLALKTDVPAKDGKVVLDGLRPGAYRAVAGDVSKDVTVKAGQTVKVDLSAP